MLDTNIFDYPGIYIFRYSCDLQGHQLNMAVFFWYYVKRELSRVRHVYTCVHWISHCFTGTRKSRSCLSCHPVSPHPLFKLNGEKGYCFHSFPLDIRHIRLSLIPLSWGQLKIPLYRVECRTPCPKFGHVLVKLNFQFLRGKNKFVTFVKNLSVLKLFPLSDGDFFFVACLQHLQTLRLVRDSLNV